MSIVIQTVRTNLVFADGENTWRWYDAIGPGVTKQLETFATWPVDDTTGYPREWRVTAKGAGSAFTFADTLNGELLITTAGAEDDGINMQLGGVAGECVLLDSSSSVYCGIRLKISDAPQSDLFFGLGVTDTGWSNGITDGAYFRKIDGTSNLEFVWEKNSLETAVVIGTIEADTYYTLEFYFDGSVLYVYVDGAAVAKRQLGRHTFPSDELLRLTLEALTGSTKSIIFNISWIRMIQVRA